MIVGAESQLNKMKSLIKNEWQAPPPFSFVEKRIDLSGFNPSISPEEFKISFIPGDKLVDRKDIEIEFRISHKGVVGITAEIESMNLKEFKYKKDEDFLQRAYECALQLVIIRQSCCCPKSVFKQEEISLDGLRSNFFIENLFNYDEICSFKIRVEIHKPCLKSESPMTSASKKVIELEPIPACIKELLLNNSRVQGKK